MSKFKQGDKVICIDIKNDFYSLKVNLTQGNMYVIGSDSITNRVTGAEVVFIDDDRGIGDLYNASRFIRLNEYRSNVINTILDL